MIKILANDGMAKEAVEKLQEQGYEVDINSYQDDELVKRLCEVDVVVIRSKTKIRKELIDKIKDKSLKLIIRAGVGIDNIDHIYAEEVGIKVKNTPNSSADSVAELSLAHMFTLARHLHSANVTMNDGQWNKKAYEGIELAGKTLGLIGFGRIARALAVKAKALGMTVYYYDRVGDIKNPEFEYKEFDEILRISDFISLHVPFIKEEGAVVSKREFDLMKDSAYLINCARGGVVDENAMLKALDENKIKGVALDVFEEEPVKNKDIYTHEKISVSPHIGGSTKEAQTRIGFETVDVINKFFEK